MTTITINGSMTLGELLAFYRKRAKLEQVDMAARFAVNRATISGWENGKTEPKFSQVVAWAQITGQSLDALVDAVNAKTAPAVAGAVSGLSQHSARLEGLEPPTFWSVAEEDSADFWTASRSVALAELWLEVEAVAL